MQVLVLLQRLARTLENILAPQHFIAAMAAVTQTVGEHASGEPSAPICNTSIAGVCDDVKQVGDSPIMYAVGSSLPDVPSVSCCCMQTHRLGLCLFSSLYGASSP